MAGLYFTLVHRHCPVVAREAGYDVRAPGDRSKENRRLYVPVHKLKGSWFERRTSGQDGM